jgi:hypothetical protein
MSYKKYLKKLHKNKNIGYIKLLHCLYINGNKSSWTKDINDVINYIFRIFNITTVNFIWQLYKKLHSSIEVRTYKKRGRIFNTPFIISYNRQIFQTIKWLKTYLSINNNKISKKEKLLLMCFSLFSFDTKYDYLLEKIEKTSILFELKNNNYNISLKHKMYAHYRW